MPNFSPAGQTVAGSWSLAPLSPLHYWSCPPRTEAEAKRAQMGRKEGRRRGGGGLCTCETETLIREAMTNRKTNTNKETKTKPREHR